MRVWLDDLRPMPAGFDTHVKTAAEAIDLLKTGTVEVISLDHDLGLEDIAPPSNGYHVAQWLEQAAFEGSIPPVRMFVHSQNAVGVNNIRMAITNARRFWNT